MGPGIVDLVARSPLRIRLPRARARSWDDSLAPDDPYGWELRSARARGYRRECVDFEMASEPFVRVLPPRRSSPGGQRLLGR